jgi:hypothetical protein
MISQPLIKSRPLESIDHAQCLIPPSHLRPTQPSISHFIIQKPFAFFALCPTIKNITTHVIILY